MLYSKIDESVNNYSYKIIIYMLYSKIDVSANNYL